MVGNQLALNSRGDCGLMQWVLVQMGPGLYRQAQERATPSSAVDAQAGFPRESPTSCCLAFTHRRQELGAQRAIPHACPATVPALTAIPGQAVPPCGKRPAHLRRGRCPWTSRPMALAVPNLGPLSAGPAGAHDPNTAQDIPSHPSAASEDLSCPRCLAQIPPGLQQQQPKVGSSSPTPEVQMRGGPTDSDGGGTPASRQPSAKGLVPWNPALIPQTD